MERTEQMYTLQKQLEFGKKKVSLRKCWGGEEIFWGALLEEPIPGESDLCWSSQNGALTSCSTQEWHHHSMPVVKIWGCSNTGAWAQPCQLGGLSRAALGHLVSL